MRPLTSVAVKNYQSIGEAQLDLGGLNVIVGRGDLGKSALLRAISAAIFNETGTGFIRTGTKECRVWLDMGEDAEVEWIKSSAGSAKYRVLVDGKESEFTKLGANVPAEIQSLFGIQTIEIDQTFKIRPQIHDQFDSPLLLTESASKAARALAKLTKLDVVASAQVAAARDLRRNKTALSGRQTTIAELEARLAEFPDMGKLSDGLKRAEVMIDEANDRLDRLAQVETILDKLQDAQRLMTVALPNLDGLASVAIRIDDLQNALIRQQVVYKATREIEATDAELEEANAEAMEAAEDLQNFLSTLDVCPACGQPIDVMAMGDHDD